MYRLIPMNFRKTKLLIILLLFGTLSAESGYNTIYLMEFDNLKNDFTNSHLKEALPDLIKENYKFREDITSKMILFHHIPVSINPYDIISKN